MRFNFILILFFYFGSAGAQNVNKAFAYFNEEEYELAIQEFELILPKAKKKFGAYDTTSYVHYVNWTALSYQNAQQYENAEMYYKQALDIFDRNNGQNCDSYSNILNNLAVIYSAQGKTESAFEYLEKSLRILEKNFGKDNIEYASRLNNLGQLYSDAGVYDKAIIYLLQGLELTGALYGKNHSNYGVCLNNLGLLYMGMGQNEKALDFLEKGLENSALTKGKNHSEYAVSLSNLAVFCSNLGLNDKAYDLYNEALTVIVNTRGKNDDQYGVLLSGISDIYVQKNEFQKAIDCLDEALTHCEKKYGKNHYMYAFRLNKLAALNKTLGNYEHAGQLYEQVLAIYNKRVGAQHPSYNSALNNLAILYQDMGLVDKADSMFSQVVENTKNVFGAESSEMSFMIYNQACFYQETRDYDKALPLFVSSLENYLKVIGRTFGILSEKDKESFIATLATKFRMYNSFFTRHYPEDNTVSTHMYNIELATKGMLLQSGINMRQNVIGSNDPLLIDTYEKWSMVRKTLSEQYAKPLKDRVKNLKSIEAEANTLEAEMMRKVSASGMSTAVGRIRAKDVSESLKPGEVAVEFTSFRYFNGVNWTDSILYAALILRPTDVNPILVKLFEQKQLDKLLKPKGASGTTAANTLYRGANVIDNTESKYGDHIYDLIWKPLKAYISDGSTVYFAPSGSLHQVAFAAIPSNNGVPLSEIYNLVQLSSTAMLVNNKNSVKEAPYSIALFGGINYDSGAYERVAEIQKENSKNNTLSRSLPESFERGNTSWNYLQGTLREVENISSIAGNYKSQVRLFSGAQALEEQIKALTGDQSPRILHIATHGFFFPDPKNQISDSRQTDGEQTRVYKASDNPLNRSGLLFAGANASWHNQDSSKVFEDGILTAFEAAGLYLPNTELVVLSACETGLGDIKGSEGVFGLQRAFKAAGADYLIMSLWKVPDNETEEFMTHFYGELFREKSVTESFQYAQKLMREKYKDDPFKWAAFVLVR